MSQRWWGRWLAGCAGLMLAGCASLGLDGPGNPDTAVSPAPTGVAAAPSAAASATAASSSASAPDAPRTDRRLVPTLKIDAPGDLQDLLERYLDLTRAMALPDAGSIGEAEWSRQISAAPAQARQLAQTLGYFSAQARIDAPDDQPTRLTLVVQPGPQSRVGRLTLEFQGELADLADASNAQAASLRNDAQADWPLPAGAPFTAAAWGDAKTALVGRLRANGYAAANWAGTGAQVDPETQQVRLFLVMDSGPLYRAGPIDIDGLAVHDADRVRGLAGFQPGDALTETLMLDYQERLQKTGLFDQVTVTLDPDTAQAGQAHVLVRLKEAPLQAATFAIGISTNTGPRATLEHSHRRLFDRALTARNKLEWGRDKQAWNGELSSHLSPQFERDLVGVSLERLYTDTDMVMSQRLRLGRSREAPTYERLTFTEVERARECGRDSGVLVDCADVTALSLQQHHVWRDLDNALLPTRGYSLSMQMGAGVARGTDSARGPFLRLYGRATGYWPLGQSWYSQARLELGGVLMRSDMQVPDSQRFRAGGDDSVRGYGWRTLAPINADGNTTGGKLLVTASAEIARPVSASLPSVWWAGFVDAGRAADDVQDLKPALGYGLGVRWRSPVGPLKLDWAWGRDLGKARLHLSVGIAF
ncbi:autotransporter assembly complex protein TamA [Ideonella margarita]|uniref:BamA/TamA family outer membrane protein n=1 Tax=Ideonella margarita TaxID=2984191 RepID=A0ABU9C010_9BURK